MKGIIFLFLCLAAGNAGLLFAQTGAVSPFLQYISSKALYSNDAEAQGFIDTSSDEALKGLGYFRRALLNSDDEALVLEASEYWENLYTKPRYKNALVLAYDGVLRAMYGGALPRNVIMKTFHAKKGMKKLREAMEEILESKDNLAISYVSFLQGRTHTSLPTFFKEFKKEALDNLKTAKKYLDAARKEKLYEDALLANLYTNIYTTYSIWYTKDKKSKKALRYLYMALKEIEGYSQERTRNIEKMIQEIKDI